MCGAISLPFKRQKYAKVTPEVFHLKTFWIHSPIFQPSGSRPDPYSFRLHPSMKGFSQMILFKKREKKHKNHRVSSLEISRPLEIAKCSSFNVKQTQRRPSVTNPIGWTALKRPGLQLGMERQRALWVRNPSDIFPNWISVNKKNCQQKLWVDGGCGSMCIWVAFYKTLPWNSVPLWCNFPLPSCIAFHFNWTNGQSVAACHVIYRLL